MSNEHRRHKKLERQRKKRQAASKKRARSTGGAQTERALAEQARKHPFGPCFLSTGWNNPDDEPQLVLALVTRERPDGKLIPATALVDRTCLGIKNGYMIDPTTSVGLDEILQSFANIHSGMERVDALVAQSVVFHAVDYAGRLGFPPHRDFPAAAFGPRPAVLIDTPWAKSPRPRYYAGPHDSQARVLARLRVAVGEDGFDVRAARSGMELIEGADDEALDEPNDSPDDSPVDEST